MREYSPRSQKQFGLARFWTDFYRSATLSSTMPLYMSTSPTTAGVSVGELAWSLKSTGDAWQAYMMAHATQMIICRGNPRLELSLTCVVIT